MAEILQHGSPGATKMVVGAGEFPNLDDPEFFNDALNGARTWPRSPCAGQPGATLV